MKKSLFYLLGVVGLFFAFSCDPSSSSDSNSSDSSSGTKITFSGSVVDGEISGADVSIINIEDESKLEGKVKSGEDGSFSIEVEIPEGKEIEDYAIQAEGGSDITSGDEVDGVVMTKPIEGKTEQVVTPITSMLFEDVKEWVKANKGKKAKSYLATAKTKIKDALGLDSEADVTANPLKNDKVLRNAVLLHKLAKKVKKNERAKAFQFLKKVLSKDANKGKIPSGKTFADAAAEDGGDGALKALLDDAELKLEGASGDSAKPDEKVKNYLAVFQKDASNKKASLALAENFKELDADTKRRKAALYSSLVTKISANLLKRDAVSYSDLSERKKSYGKGIARLSIYLTALVKKLDKATIGKLLGSGSDLGFLKGYAEADLTALGEVDLTSADTDSKKLLAITSASGGAVATKLKAIITAIKADTKLPLEDLVKAASVDIIFGKLSTYLSQE